MLLFIVLASTSVLAAKQKAPQEGWLYVDAFFDSAPGFVPPRVWIYDEEGRLVNSTQGAGDFPIGLKIPVPPGRYQVEVGTQPSEYNRHWYTVKNRMMTIVKTGVILIQGVPRDQQPADICPKWSARLDVMVDYKGEGQLVATNKTANPDAAGALQLHEGTYVLHSNGLSTSVEVKDGQFFLIPTGWHGGRNLRDHRLNTKEERGAGNMSAVMCAHNPTLVLAGTYWETFVEEKGPMQRSEIRRQVTVIPAGDHGYSRERSKPRPRGAVYRGPGSEGAAVPYPPPRPNAPLITPSIGKIPQAPQPPEPPQPKAKPEPPTAPEPPSSHPSAPQQPKAKNVPEKKEQPPEEPDKP